MSLFISYDDACVEVLLQLNILHQLQRKYNLSFELYNELRRSIKQSSDFKSRRLKTFVGELPHDAQRALASEMHKRILGLVPFLKDKDAPFINWLGLMLTQKNFTELEYITHDGEGINESKIL